MLERLFVEERRRLKIIPNAFGERAVRCLKSDLVFGSHRIEKLPMSYAEHWFALATRIKSLRMAGELYASFQGYQQEDSFRATVLARLP